MLKLKKLQNQIEIYENHELIYADSYDNFKLDMFNIDSEVSLTYEYALVDSESSYYGNADLLCRYNTSEDWVLVFSKIQEVLTNKKVRDEGKTISAEITSAIAKVDEMAGAVRKKYLTDSFGQETTYLIKGQQAQSFKAAGFSGTVPSLVLAEANATNTTPKIAAEAIIQKENEWLNVVAIIEEVRRYSKIKIENATKIDRVRFELNNAIARFQGLL